MFQLSSFGKTSGANTQISIVYNMCVFVLCQKNFWHSPFSRFKIFGGWKLNGHIICNQYALTENLIELLSFQIS